MIRSCFLTLPALIIFSGLAHAYDNEEVSVDLIPAAALKTAQTFAPSLHFDRYAYEDEAEGRIYEFEGRDAQGRHIEIDVFADGRLQEIEIETEWDEVPANVQIELMLTDDEFQPLFIEASTRPDGTTVYEFEGLNRWGEPGDIEILLDGTGVKLVAERGVPNDFIRPEFR